MSSETLESTSIGKLPNGSITPSATARLSGGSDDAWDGGSETQRAHRGWPGWHAKMWHSLHSTGLARKKLLLSATRARSTSPASGTSPGVVGVVGCVKGV